MLAQLVSRRWTWSATAIAAAALLVLVTVIEPRSATAQAVPAFGAAGELLIPRTSFPAFLVPNGLIVIGGDFESEAFSPVDGESIPLNVVKPDNFRRSSRGVQLTDGRLFVSGGRGGTVDNSTTVLPSRPLDSTMLFEPTAGVWSAGPRLGQARLLHTATLLADGKVLIAGGSLNTSPAGFTRPTETATAELYDPATNSMTTVSPMTRVRSSHSATLLSNGRVLIAGYGAEIYDPSTRTFRALTGAPPLAEEHTATLLRDGTVLLVAGVDPASPIESNVKLAAAWRFNPTTETFTAAGALPEGRSAHTATLLQDGSVLIVGGARSGTGSGRQIATAVRYTPSTNQWSPAGTLLEGRYLHAAVAMPDGRVIILGGTDGTDTLFTVEAWSANGVPVAPVGGGKPYAGSAPRAGSQGLLVTTQLTSIDALVSSVRADGCTARVIGLLQNGTWRLYIPGAPAVVNAGFPASLPPTTALFVGCS